MVNITNNQVKLIKKLMDYHFNHKYDLKLHFECQDMLVDLEAKIKHKSELNKEQYEERKFWIKYEKNKVIK